MGVPTGLLVLNRRNALFLRGVAVCRDSRGQAFGPRRIGTGQMETERMDDSELQTKLVALRQEHRDLDDAISALVGTGVFDQLKLRRLKKRKLALKDEISNLEDQLLPDIIA